jgi:phosphohistidine phosphatase SixA
MTLENCKRLLKHYEATGQDEAALDMRRKLAQRGHSEEKEYSHPKKKGA